MEHGRVILKGLNIIPINAHIRFLAGIYQASVPVRMDMGRMAYIANNTQRKWMPNDKGGDIHACEGGEVMEMDWKEAYMDAETKRVGLDHKCDTLRSALKDIEIILWPLSAMASIEHTDVLLRDMKPHLQEMQEIIRQALDGHTGG